MRTQELLDADRYYGVDQYWTRTVDYGFSKTREEALEKWGHDRVLAEVVRVIRLTRPLVLASVFAGAPTDGHGNHQVSGQMAQEAFLAAGDPNKFPEQLKEGLRPWAPAKVYSRVPFFEPTKEGMYDYATDKFVPVRFFDYVHQKWLNERPATNVEVSEGDFDNAAGLTYLQMGRTGLGKQKSQNGGGTTPPAGPQKTAYHRYGSTVATQDKEKSFYDGLDVSLVSIATLAKGDTRFLQQGLQQLDAIAMRAADANSLAGSTRLSGELAQGLADTRTLIERVRSSNLAEPGQSDVLFELRVKERQFERALVLSLGVSLQANIAPAQEPTGVFAAFMGPGATSTTVIPGQSFAVQTHLYNPGTVQLTINKLTVENTDQKDWKVRTEKPVPSAISEKQDVSSRFAVTAAADAALTKPYFSRPNEEQPFYDYSDARFQGLSTMPYPMIATAQLTYKGVPFTLRQVVQSRERQEGIGLVSQPVLVGPAISVSLSRRAGAVPLTSRSFLLPCTIRSNVAHEAKGKVNLHLPEGWTSSPKLADFKFTHEGEEQTIPFEVTPGVLDLKSNVIKASAQYEGKSYEDGYRLVSYPGLRPSPYYQPARYEVVGVDVKTAPELRVGYVAGTGDDVPQALSDLGVNVTYLSPHELDGDLSRFDALVLGVRAYTARAELRSQTSQLLQYVNNGGAVIVQYNLGDFDHNFGPYPYTLGSNPAKVVDELSPVKILDATNPLFTWPNKITVADFKGWQEERGHGFMATWDSHYKPLIETQDPDQNPQKGGLLIARYGKGAYIYDALALYRQLPAGVPGSYRLLANLVSIGKNPAYR